MKWKLEYKTIEIKEASGEYITTPGNVVSALNDIFNPVAEEMYMLIMNVKNRVIERHLICKGSHNTMLVQPADIFRPLLMNGGCNFILAHNHPSGDNTPSEEDIVFTKKIKKASEILGVNLLDHIIFTGKDSYSFKKNSLID